MRLERAYRRAYQKPVSEQPTRSQTRISGFADGHRGEGTPDERSDSSADPN